MIHNYPPMYSTSTSCIMLFLYKYNVNIFHNICHHIAECVPCQAYTVVIKIRSPKHLNLCVFSHTCIYVQPIEMFIISCEIKKGVISSGYGWLSYECICVWTIEIMMPTDMWCCYIDKCLWCCTLINCFSKLWLYLILMATYCHFNEGYYRVR